MIIDHLDNDALLKALDALKNKEIFVYPTDTIYGFGGDARSEDVINGLYLLKQRPAHMPVSMLVHDLDMLQDFAVVSKKAKQLIEGLLPGALTLVLPSKDIRLPERLFSMQGYLGFRMPDHGFCRALSREFGGPIITTSVNVSGQPALNDIDSIQKQFGKEVDLMIRDHDLDEKDDIMGSTVVLITDKDKMKILRRGSISENQVREVLIDL